jgi:hypothetical protein
MHNHKAATKSGKRGFTELPGRSWLIIARLTSCMALLMCDVVSLRNEGESQQEASSRAV